MVFTLAVMDNQKFINKYNHYVDEKLTDTENKEIIETIIKCLSESLCQGEKIQIRNFGTFMVKKGLKRG